MLLATLATAIPTTVAKAGTAVSGKLTFTYTPTINGTEIPLSSKLVNPDKSLQRGPITEGTTVTYRLEITNDSTTTYYRNSVSDSGCKSLTFREELSSKATFGQIRPGGKAVFTCDKALAVTTTTTANVSYSYYDSWDYFRFWPNYLSAKSTETIKVTIDSSSSPALTCTTPTVFVAANDASAEANEQTKLYNQFQYPDRSDFIDIGNTMIGTKKVQYNAMAWNPADGYIYAISSRPIGAQNNDAWYPYGHLLRIDAAGNAKDLGALDTADIYGTNTRNCDDGRCDEDTEGGITSGAIHDGTYYFSNASSSGTRYMYSMPLTNLDTVISRDVTTISYSNTFETNDYAHLAGYLWGIENHSAGPTLLRYKLTAPGAGTVNSYSLSSLGFKTGQTYGAVWTYGNGNLGFSDNSGSGIYQLKVTNPTTSTPGFSLVYQMAGPGSTNNDGTSCVTDNNVDLKIEKTGPATVRPSTGTASIVTWNLVITNLGTGVSSGGVLKDTVPAGYTNVNVDPAYKDVCRVDGQNVSCQTGVLNPGDSYAIPISANAPSTIVCLTNTATVTGNEHDPVDTNNTSSLVTCTTNAIIDAIKEKAGNVTRNNDGTYTAPYTVTVRNQGTASGKYTEITDRPRLDAGMTIKTLSWAPFGSNAFVEATPTADGDYLIGGTTEKTLTTTAPGNEHKYTVDVTFTREPTTTLGTCATGGGIYNRVSLPQEDKSKVDQNNATCYDPSPYVNLQKTAVENGIVGPANDGTYTVAYQVSVTNTGLTSGTYGQITDTLEFDPKFTPVSAVWKRTDIADGATATSTFAANSAAHSFLIGADSTSIAVNATHTYSVTVTYSINPNVTTAVTQCSETRTPGQGLFNSVTLPAGQEHAPVTDNWACIAPNPAPVIDLEKQGWTDQAHTKPATTLDGPTTVYYTYKVSLPEGAQEPLRDVTLKDDVYTLGLMDAKAAGRLTDAGALAAAASVPSTSVAPTLTSGDDGDGLLEVGEVWVYTYASAAPISATTKNVATVTGKGAISTKQVSKTDDWTVVMTPRQITVQKLGADSQKIGGASFALYDTDPTAADARPMASGITVNSTDTSVFTSTGLQFGMDYWLVETKAPEGHELLAHPVKFSLTADGVQIAEQARNGATVTVTSGNAFGITVSDAPRSVLPAAGGFGASAPWAALLLLVTALTTYRAVNRTRTTSEG
ncbi:MAG: SpaA isopeptide-forming pilin-related protein [Dermatophilus congolensis]|nr:SpaA isopeptide-forming pilin-related protein [Dermatophilus congolensis]